MASVDLAFRMNTVSIVAAVLICALLLWAS
jgi:hypothetical protein